MPKMKKSTKPGKNYISNDDFLHELKFYHKTHKISKQLHLIFYELCVKIARKNRWYMNKKTSICSRYSDLVTDMIHTGYLKCIEKVDYFDIETRTNPFCYYTTLVHNCFMEFVGKDLKYSTIKDICQEEYDHRFLIKYGFKRTVTDENLNNG